MDPLPRRRYQKPPDSACDRRRPPRRWCGAVEASAGEALEVRNGRSPSSGGSVDRSTDAAHPASAAETTNAATSE